MNGQKIIDLATAEIGYKEGANKDNKFGVWFGMNNVSWCMMFCDKMYSDAGFPIKGDFTKGFASVPNCLKHYTSTNELTNYPQAGDLVLFDWNGDKYPDHVGLYVCNNGDGTITTIEGNTSDGNPSDGGCVQKKIRKLTLVEAFIHPSILDANESA
jgi:cell wall-associated NlpC family hydrolase